MIVCFSRHVPSLADYDRSGQSLVPMEMIFQGISISLFHAKQRWSGMLPRRYRAGVFCPLLPHRPAILPHRPTMLLGDEALRARCGMRLIRSSNNLSDAIAKPVD